MKIFLAQNWAFLEKELKKIVFQVYHISTDDLKLFKKLCGNRNFKLFQIIMVWNYLMMIWENPLGLAKKFFKKKFNFAKKWDDK